MHFLGLIDITTAGKTNGKRSGERRQVRSRDDEYGERAAGLRWVGWGQRAHFAFLCVCVCFLRCLPGLKHSKVTVALWPHIFYK